MAIAYWAARYANEERSLKALHAQVIKAVILLLTFYWFYYNTTTKVPPMGLLTKNRSFSVHHGFFSSQDTVICGINDFYNVWCTQMLITFLDLFLSDTISDLKQKAWSCLTYCICLQRTDLIPFGRNLRCICQRLHHPAVYFQISPYKEIHVLPRQ